MSYAAGSIDSRNEARKLQKCNPNLFMKQAHGTEDPGPVFVFVISWCRPLAATELDQWDIGIFSFVPRALPPMGGIFSMTYLRGKLAPSVPPSDGRLPPQISHEKTAPSRQSLQKRHQCPTEHLFAGFGEVTA
jgi:hypothetical protein